MATTSSIVARAIPFHSLCMHHLLPFMGVAHIGYLPGERIIGLSKLGRVVELFARDLQIQERLTTQVAGWLQRELAPTGVGVVLEAEHMCMSLRGVQKLGARTVTSALHGLIRDDAAHPRRVPGPDDEELPRPVTRHARSSAWTAVLPVRPVDAGLGHVRGHRDPEGRVEALARRSRARRRSAAGGRAPGP